MTISDKTLAELVNKQLTSFTAQMEYYTQRIADTEGWTMVKMYADKGISGTSAKRRPKFLKMIRDAEKGKIDLVITKSVSRSFPILGQRPNALSNASLIIE